MVEVKYNGRKYKVRSGTRGGHYITVKGEKKYVNMKQKTSSTMNKSSGKKVARKSRGLRMSRMSNFKLFGGARDCVLEGLVFPLSYVQKTLKDLPVKFDRMGLPPGFISGKLKGSLEKNPSWMWKLSLVNPSVQGFNMKRIGPFPNSKAEHYTNSDNFQNKVVTKQKMKNGKPVLNENENQVMETVFINPEDIPGVGSELVENEFFSKFLCGPVIGDGPACVDMDKYSESTEFIIGGLMTRYSSEKTLTIKSNSDIDSVTKFYLDMKNSGTDIFGRKMVFDQPGMPAMKYYREIFDVGQLDVSGHKFLIVSFNPANSKPFIMPSNYQVLTYVYSLDDTFSNLHCTETDINVSVEGLNLGDMTAIPILHSDILPKEEVYKPFRRELKSHLTKLFESKGMTYYDISDQTLSTVSMAQMHIHGFCLLKDANLAQYITLKNNVISPDNIELHKVRKRPPYSNRKAFNKSQKGNPNLTYQGYLEKGVFKNLNNNTNKKLINRAINQLKKQPYMKAKKRTEIYEDIFNKLKKSELKYNHSKVVKMINEEIQNTNNSTTILNKIKLKLKSESLANQNGGWW